MRATVKVHVVGQDPATYWTSSRPEQDREKKAFPSTIESQFRNTFVFIYLNSRSLVHFNVASVLSRLCLSSRGPPQQDRFRRKQRLTNSHRLYFDFDARRFDTHAHTSSLNEMPVTVLRRAYVDVPHFHINWELTNSSKSISDCKLDDKQIRAQFF